MLNAKKKIGKNRNRVLVCRRCRHSRQPFAFFSLFILLFRNAEQRRRFLCSQFFKLFFSSFFFLCSTDSFIVKWRLFCPSTEAEHTEKILVSMRREKINSWRNSKIVSIGIATRHCRCLSVLVKMTAKVQKSISSVFNNYYFAHNEIIIIENA